MAKQTATAGEWTTVTDTGGAMWLQARYMGVYVHTGGLPPVDPTEANTLPDGGEIVVGAGIVVDVWPIRAGEDTVVYSQVI